MQGKDDSILKSVYCNYRGRVTVYDVHGQKVHELSGMLDYDKYLEIERRTDPEITQFEGLEDYRCIACELKKKKSESDAESNQSASPLLGSCASVKLPNGTTNSGYSANTNSGYSPLAAPRVAPLISSMPLRSMPLPATGPNSVVNNNSSGVRVRPNRFPSPPPVGIKGSYYYNTTECKLYYCDGNSWIWTSSSLNLSPPPPLPVINVDDHHYTKTPEIIKEERWWKRIFK